MGRYKITMGHVMLLGAFALGLSACAGSGGDADPDKAQGMAAPPAATGVGLSRSPSPVPLSSIATPTVVRIDPLPPRQLIHDTLEQCAYVIEIYTEYRSAPDHGVDREVTMCLNRMALQGF